MRVIAGDVSLAREPPRESSILNVGPGRILQAKPVDTDEIVAVVSLGADGSGARLLSRLTRKAWDHSASRRRERPHPGQGRRPRAGAGRIGVEAGRSQI